MSDNNALDKVFTKASDTINGAERAILDFISVFVPWAVPVIPAYLTYFHTINQMEFPSWVATTSAFVVEALGLVSVATAIRFWKNNTLFKGDREKAPFWLAVVVYIFYIVIVLTVNVLLEVEAAERNSTVIFAIGLFTLLSFPASLLIAIRAQFREQLEDRNARRAERRTKTQTSNVVYAKETNFDLPEIHREKLTKVCPGCDKTFTTTFPHKVTCSDRCRQRVSRRKNANVS